MTSEQIQQILVIVLATMGLILTILVGVLFFLNVKSHQHRKKVENKLSEENQKEALTVSSYAQYSKKSIYNFMEFEKIEDNMIIQKAGVKYLMIAECQGVNYDLMSQAEKNGVEAGFVQFLNTLRHSIQIYTQTRTVNLESSIATYKDRLKNVEEKLAKMRAEYERMLKSREYSSEEVEKYFFELTKQNNLYEYGKDIIFNTEKMSLNKNVLNKQYYIVVPYYATELGPNNFEKDEIQNIAFSELYTRTQSLIRALGTCGVVGRILTSNELVDVLYMAYNRDEAEVFGLDKIIRSGYDELYSTAPDVMDKKMQELDRKIEEAAIERANNKIYEVKSEKERAVIEKEQSFEDLVDEMAKMFIEDNKMYVGEGVAEKAVESIEKDRRKRDRGEGGISREEKEKARARAKRRV